jgi:hypothetical protein
MPALSRDAAFIVDRMEPNRRYGAGELRALVPDASIERLREIMHELWVARQVERAGDSCWRRHRSGPGETERPASRDVRIVKPQDLFDHDTFEEFFK